MASPDSALASGQSSDGDAAMAERLARLQKALTVPKPAQRAATAPSNLPQQQRPSPQSQALLRSLQQLQAGPAAARVPPELIQAAIQDASLSRGEGLTNTLAWAAPAIMEAARAAKQQPVKQGAPTAQPARSPAAAKLQAAQAAVSAKQTWSKPAGNPLSPSFVTHNRPTVPAPAAQQQRAAACSTLARPHRAAIQQPRPAPSRLSQGVQGGSAFRAVLPSSVSLPAVPIRPIACRPLAAVFLPETQSLPMPAPGRPLHLSASMAPQQAATNDMLEDARMYEGAQIIANIFAAGRQPERASAEPRTEPQQQHGEQAINGRSASAEFAARQPGNRPAPGSDPAIREMILGLVPQGAPPISLPEFRSGQRDSPTKRCLSICVPACKCNQHTYMEHQTLCSS